MRIYKIAKEYTLADEASKMSQFLVSRMENPQWKTNPTISQKMVQQLKDNLVYINKIMASNNSPVLQTYVSTINRQISEYDKAAQTYGPLKTVMNDEWIQTVKSALQNVINDPVGKSSLMAAEQQIPAEPTQNYETLQPAQLKQQVEPVETGVGSA